MGQVNLGFGTGTRPLTGGTTWMQGGRPFGNNPFGGGGTGTGTFNLFGGGGSPTTGTGGTGQIFGMSPFELGSLGLGGFGAWLQARGQGKQLEGQMQMNTQQMLENARQFNQSMRQRQTETGLSATQMDPMFQTKRRASAALAEALMSGYQPASFNPETASFSGGLRAMGPQLAQVAGQYLNQDARFAGEQAFHQNARAASPTYQAPSGTAAGYGREFDLAPPINLNGGSPEQTSVRQIIDSLSGSNFQGGPGGASGALGGGVSGAGLGFKYGGWLGAGIGGAAGAIIGGITGSRNDTKGEREELATQLGFGSLHALNQYLNTLGKDGQDLAHIGMNIIGKHDTERNALWMQTVYQLVMESRG